MTNSTKTQVNASTASENTAEQAGGTPLKIIVGRDLNSPELSAFRHILTEGMRNHPNKISGPQDLVHGGVTEFALFDRGRSWSILCHEGGNTGYSLTIFPDSFISEGEYREVFQKLREAVKTHYQL